jgi:hypothetical protein
MSCLTDLFIFLSSFKHMCNLLPQLLIDPINLKSFARWLTGKVNEYEELFGNIPPECQQQTAEIGDIKKRA